MTKTASISRWIIALAIALSVKPGSVLAAERSDAWTEVRPPHFVIYSNAGDKEARRVALRFEEIRAAFLAAFPDLRVDAGKPMSVLALADADSMKEFLPDFWAAKDGVRPAGLFLGSFDKNYAVLRLDANGTGENPFHSLYHEYTHAILRVNFRKLPLWLNEGLADYYGNAILEENGIELGRVSRAELGVLQHTPLIPVATLMKVDQGSPLYNENSPASLFYAESWGLVHFLLTDPEAAKNKLLTKYFKLFEETDDAEEAARGAFGDLKNLEERLQRYARQPNFRGDLLKSKASLSDKNLAARQLSRAEGQTLRADFLQHSGHSREARPLLKEALELEPKLAAAHACAGYDDYLTLELDGAEKEFSEAAQLDPSDFRAFFYLAEIAYLRKGYTAQNTLQVIAHLEKTAQLNPDFAPAYGFLSLAYLQRSDTRFKALDAALKANWLEPTGLAYVADTGNAYMMLGRKEEAHAVSTRLDKAAITPQERYTAREFARRLARHEEFAAKKQAQALESGGVAIMEEETPPDSPHLQPASGPEFLAGAQLAAAVEIKTAEGEVEEAECQDSRNVKMKFAAPEGTLLLAAPDAAKITYWGKRQDSMSAADGCSQWKGRKASVIYKVVPAEGKPGEILSIEFFR